MTNAVHSLKFRLFTFIYILLLAHSAHGNSIYVEKSIFGRREEVLIFKEQLKFKAKLDTGAKTSSLSATGIHEREINGKTWVYFNIMDPKSQKLLKKKFPLERYAYIKQHRHGNHYAKHTKRPVIKLPLCLGTQVRDIEVNLVDRRHFLYPVLLGRDTIVQFNGIVDPSKEYTTAPICEVNR